MRIAVLPLLWGWLGGTTMNQLLGVGVLLGVAGASFAISLPLASRWYPPATRGWRWASPAPATPAPSRAR